MPAGTVNLIGPDTDVTPDAGKTSASRQTFITGNAARIAGKRLRTAVLELAGAMQETRIELGESRIELYGTGTKKSDMVRLDEMPVCEDGFVLSATGRYDPPVSPLDERGRGSPYAQFAYAVHMAELAVDLDLGHVHMSKITAVHDVGRAINPLLAEGQIQGGIAQGLGMALMEEFLPGYTDGFDTYLIPTICDVPPIETILVEEADPHGPYGAKGLGELALIPTAPAILNAIRDATGAEIAQLPATPARVVEALRAISRKDYR